MLCGNVYGLPCPVVLPAWPSALRQAWLWRHLMWAWVQSHLWQEGSWEQLDSCSHPCSWGNCGVSARNGGSCCAGRRVTLKKLQVAHLESMRILVVCQQRHTVGQHSLGSLGNCVCMSCALWVRTAFDNSAKAQVWSRTLEEQQMCS